MQLQLYRVRPWRNRNLQASVVKRVGIAEVVAGDVQFRLPGRYFQEQEGGGAWRRQGGVMHIPDRCGVDVVMHVFLDDYRAVCIMDVGMVAVRIKRIAHRHTHADTYMQAFV